MLDLTAHAWWNEQRYPDPVGRVPSWEEAVVVAGAYDGAGGRNFLLEGKLEAGEYAVRVSGARTANYRLVLESFRDDHDDWAQQATPVAFGSPTAGAIELPGDVDYFRIPVEALGVGARIVVFSTGDLDTMGSLENESGESLATDDDGGAGGNFRLVHDNRGLGSIFVRVRGHRGATGPYALVVEVAADGG